MCGITTDNVSAERSCVKRSKIRVRVKTSANEYQQRLYTAMLGLLCVTLHVHSALIMSYIIQFKDSCHLHISLFTLPNNVGLYLYFDTRVIISITQIQEVVISFNIVIKM